MKKACVILTCLLICVASFLFADVSTNIATFKDDGSDGTVSAIDQDGNLYCPNVQATNYVTCVNLEVTGSITMLTGVGYTGTNIIGSNTFKIIDNIIIDLD